VTYEGEWKESVNLPLRIIVEARRNARVSLSRRGICIRLPENLSEADKRKQLADFKEWIRKKISKDPDRFVPVSEKKHENGDRLKVGGIAYTLKIEYGDRKSGSARLRDNTIHLSLPVRLKKHPDPKAIPALLSRCMARVNYPWLKDRLRELNERHFKRKIGKITFKYNKSNWGSCSSLGNINISTRLLFAPASVRDYVLIHELAHLVEKNHSRKFWSIVRAIVPDYREKRKWLKTNSEKCRF
jgi:predicted metal-dependent hydrolase